jgi:chaperonin GroES
MKIMGIRVQPLADKIVVEPEEAEAVTPGGILLPDSAQERPHRGKVLAVGPGKTLPDGSIQAMTVREGDVVLFGKYAGNLVEVGDEEYLIMREDDVLAVVKE